MSAGAEMPRYRCHKEVWALKIKDYKVDIADGELTIIPADEGYAEFVPGAEWAARAIAAVKHDYTALAGGYYVVYADGFKSFSPAKAFEEGYTKL